MFAQIEKWDQIDEESKKKSEIHYEDVLYNGIYNLFFELVNICTFCSRSPGYLFIKRQVPLWFNILWTSRSKIVLIIL